MRDGRAGLGHPPWQGGGGGVARLRCVCKGEQRGFLKGSERPEAGCLGEFLKTNTWGSNSTNHKP